MIYICEQINKIKETEVNNEANPFIHSFLISRAPSIRPLFHLSSHSLRGLEEKDRDRNRGRTRKKERVSCVCEMYVLLNYSIYEFIKAKGVGFSFEPNVVCFLSAKC